MRLPSVASVLRLAARHPRYFLHLLEKKYRFGSRYNWVKTNRGKSLKAPMPLVYRLNLTWECNLRCAMCMIWGDDGWKRKNSQPDTAAELDWSIVNKILEYPHKVRPSVILNGGEPLLYGRCKDLLVLLKEKKIFTTMCTNGMLLEQYENLLCDNPFLALVVSLDGLEKENDLIRGAGVYKKVVGNIARLKKLKKPPYIGVQFTVQPENAHLMHEFSKEMEKLGVDWILFNLRWFVTGKERTKYEEIMAREFDVRAESCKNYVSTLALDRKTFIEQYNRINAARWPMQISCFLKNAGDVAGYADSVDIQAGTALCYKQWLRMDILPDGKVTPCTSYPDLTIGDLHEMGVEELWNSPLYDRFRSAAAEKLLPVCKKCAALYLYNAERKYL